MTKPSARALALADLAAELRLTKKQQAFCLALAADPERNQSAAAVKAGLGKSGYATAYKWLKLAHVRKYMEALTKEATLEVAKTTERGIMSVAETLGRLSEQARADMGDFIETRPDGTFSFNLHKAKEMGLTRHIKKLKHDHETGAPVLEMVDSQGALDKLAKHHRLYGDTEAAPVQVRITLLQALRQLPSAELEQAERLLGQVIDVEAEEK